MRWQKRSWGFPGIRRIWAAPPGFISIMHTWGSNLSYHPHIHVLCTGGGLDADRNWHQKKGGFFLPGKAMAALFKGKFLSGLKALHEAGESQL